MALHLVLTCDTPGCTGTVRAIASERTGDSPTSLLDRAAAGHVTTGFQNSREWHSPWEIHRARASRGQAARHYCPLHAVTVR